MTRQSARASKSVAQPAPEQPQLEDEDRRPAERFAPGAALTLQAPAATTGPALQRRLVVQLQRAHGNAALARRLQRAAAPLQREPTVKPQWQQEMEQDGAVLELPKAFKWDFAAPIATDELGEWSAVPQFSTPVFAKHLGEPYISTQLVAPMNQRKAKFGADWGQLAGSWKRARELAGQFQLKAKTPPGQAAGQPGQAGGIADQDSESAKPKGEQGQTVASLFDESDPTAVRLNAKTPFNPANLGAKDRETYDAKMKAAHESSNAVKDAKLSIDNAMSKVLVANSQQVVASLKLKQAEGGADSKAAGAQKVDVQAEQTQIKNLLDALNAAAAVGGSLAEGKPYGALEKGVTYIGALIAMEYTQKIATIDAKIAQLDAKIAQLQVQCEVEGIKQAVEAVRQASIEVKKAKLALSNAALAEEQAFRYFSQTIEELGKKLNMDPASIKAASTAAAALPLLEDTIKQFEQVEGAIVLPAYGEESGGGAAMALNIGDFVLHLAQLKGYQQQLAQGKLQWMKRRDAARSGIGMPAAPSL